LRLEMVPIDPVLPIMAAIETVLPSAVAKGVRIVKSLDSRAGPVAGDAGRLQQVVWNLLSNAVKFTDKGGQIEVSLARGPSHIQITVSDTGKGIEAGFLPHIFERFRQADASTTRQHGGLGLGLAIVQQLVEMHGGSIRASSGGEKKGSVFSIDLPLLAADPNPIGTPRFRLAGAGPRSASARSELAGVRVLVVDDEKDAREMVRRILNDCGATVTMAASAAEALELFPALMPHVLISDVGMPEMDGYELLRRLRNLANGEGRDFPAIALTALARTEDRERAMHAGFHIHMAKPIEPHELVAAVARATSGNPKENARR
jgi:CheY-like chemotaxis protein/anti-sigma regulatory factor (Ser/Thr protein kinase)